MDFTFNKYIKNYNNFLKKITTFNKNSCKILYKKW